MSADNGIYILVTKSSDGSSVYRVAYASAIDDLNWYMNSEPYNVGAYLVRTWGESEVYQTETDAMGHALRLSGLVPSTEYGVRFIKTDYVFFGDR